MSGTQWYKGNIHTHTTESDGDEDPHKVVRWYRRHGYDFLVLSDHNHLTLLDYGSDRRRFRKPLMVPGEEVSVRINGAKRQYTSTAWGFHMSSSPSTLATWWQRCKPMWMR